MIELELKFQTTNTSPCLCELTLLNTKKQTDIYYDTKNYDLLRKGNFLRVRNNSKLEFKIDIPDNNHLYCKETAFSLSDLTHKINDINMIFEFLNINKSPSFNNTEEFIELNNLQIIAPINKIRKSYKLDDRCTICVDEVEDLGTFIEAEVMIDDDALDLKTAEQIKNELIEKLIHRQIIETSSVQVNVGYVELYLKKHNAFAYDLGKFKL